MSRHQYAMVMDLNKCIGCQTCTMACKKQWTDGDGQGRTGTDRDGMRQVSHSMERESRQRRKAARFRIGSVIPASTSLRTPTACAGSSNAVSSEREPRAISR